MGSFARELSFDTLNLGSFDVWILSFGEFRKGISVQDLSLERVLFGSPNWELSLGPSAWKVELGSFHF